jgi:hypothetical protein
MNRFFMEYNGALSTADAQTWVNNAFSAWGATGSLVTRYNVLCALTRVVLTDLSTSSSPQAEKDGNTVGVDSGNVLGAADAMILRFKINRRYRGGKPRMYIGGQTQGSLISTQSWSASAQAALLAAWAVFKAAVIAGAPAPVGVVKQVNVSYFQGFTNVTFPSGRTRPVPKLRVGGPIVDDIVATSTNPRVASQRRRNLQST